MMLQEPPASQADLHFRLFGFPVRIHPFFWVIVILLGISPGRGGETPPEALLIWVAVVLVSILVHELGHALVQRHFGGRPWITLHGFGGLASCDDCDRSPRSQILISLAGPAAGFVVAAALGLLMRIAGHQFGIALGGAEPTAGAWYVPVGVGEVYWSPPANPWAAELVYQLLFVNIVWGLVNLLPIYPLDGGQVSRELCTLGNPAQGIVLSLRISIAAAVAMAVFGAVKWESIFVALMFGYFAYSNYQTLQAYQASRW